MPRIHFDDVVPPEKRSIRNVPIPSGGKRKTPVVIRPNEPVINKKTEDIVKPTNPPQNFQSKIPEITEKKDNNAYEYYYPKNNPEKYEGNFGKSKSKKKYILGGIALAVVLIFIVGMMTVFASATINIVPKNQNIDVDLKILATNEAKEGAVGYEIIKLSKSKTVSVPATGEEAAEIKASGKIVIYNNFSTEPQRLIIRTRFESPEGLIFRIPESVVVPGKTKKDGVETPGSIEVQVFADEPGEKYNIKKTDFTIPGFKNDADRFKNFYARSSTEMEGGFVGKMKTVSESDKKTALQNIDLEIQADLNKDLGSKIPEGLALLPGSTVYQSKDLQPKEDGSSVIIGKEITSYTIMLNAQDLSNNITAEYISKLNDWTGIKAVVKNFSPLSITNVPGNIEKGGEISLEIKGKANVLADINAEVINQRLLGISKKDAAKLMDEFAGISSITATIRPIWKQSFPEDSSKIYVQIMANE